MPKRWLSFLGAQRPRLTQGQTSSRCILTLGGLGRLGVTHCISEKLTIHPTVSPGDTLMHRHTNRHTSHPQ